MKPVSEWTREDLEKLIAGEVRESLTLDYKRSAALGRSNDQRKEFRRGRAECRMTALAYFPDAWVLTLAAILIWTASAATLSIPSLNALMKVGLWTLAAFGFTTSMLAFLASGFAWTMGWKRLSPRTSN